MKKLLITLVSVAVFGLSVTAQTPLLKSINSSRSTTSVQKVGVSPKVNQKISQNQKTPEFVGQKSFFSSTTQLQSQAQKNAIAKFQAKHLQTVKQAKERNVAQSKASVSVRKSTVPDAATITLNVVGDPMGDGTGFQMFLDPDNELDWRVLSVYQEFFEVCEYHIPADATNDLVNSATVLNESQSITVPQGTYSIIFLNVAPQYEQAFLCYWDVTYDLAEGKGYNFKNGFEYIFTVDNFWYVQYNPDYDAAITDLFLPSASYDLTDSEPITIWIANRGIHEFSNIELSYQVNDREIVTEIYTDTVAAGEEIGYTFAATADFSVGGVYDVKAWVTYSEDMKPKNNTTTGATKKIAILDLPFVSNFDNPSDFLYWTVVDGCCPTSWNYDGQNEDADGRFGCIQVQRLSWEQPAGGYLVSDPLNFTDTGTYNMRFQFQLLGDESFRILYGKTPNPTEMDTLVDYPLMIGFLWDFRAINFSIDDPGIYYVAFEYYSQPGIDPIPEEWGEEGETAGGMAMNIDNIIVDKGLFIGVPDLEIVKMVAPASACDLVDSTPISVKVKNIGTEPIPEITLSYKINENDSVSETFYFFPSPLGINIERIVEFYVTADFSSLGEYNIKIEGSAADEKNDINNIYTTTVVHYDPVTELPFVSNFINAADRKEWSSTEVDGWMPNTYLGCLWPETTRIPLLSRCMTLPVGKYRFDYSYTAGAMTLGLLRLDDFYVTYGKVGEDPLTWTPVKSYRNMVTYGVMTDDDILLDITEPGDYAVAIVSTVLADVAIWKTSISEAKEHDVRLANVQSPDNFTRMIPKEHVAGDKTFDVTVKNRGTSAESGRVELSIGGTAVGSTDFYVDVEKDTTVKVTANLASLPTGTANVWFSAITENTDIIPADNTINVQKVISDSTFARDYVIGNNFPNAIGTSGATTTIGLIYELSATDTLTSINVGFWNEPRNVEFGLSVYPVTITDSVTIGEACFSVRRRLVTGSSVTFSVPATILEAGKYFFEIQEFGTNSTFYVVCDLEPSGQFYMRNDLGLKLEKIENEGYGNLLIRPNFGRTNMAVSIADLKTSNIDVMIYPNPSNGDIVLSVPEVATVEIFNASGVKVVTQQVVESTRLSLKQSGIYMVRAIAEKSGKTTTKKIVVKK
ncbi:MAG: T9SS type A sorting domain-containing protein [Bacteroidales bacterium]|jgi:hypothetical protein|nr:T9SS type A sorting domain-containing protein [Bacteroidales bacterium]